MTRCLATAMPSCELSRLRWVGEMQGALKNSNSQVKRVSHPGAHMMPSCSQGIKLELQHFLDSMAP